MSDTVATKPRRALRSPPMGRPRKSEPGTGMTLSFRAEEELIRDVDAQCAHIVPGVKLSRTQAVKMLLCEALAARKGKRKGA